MAKKDPDKVADMVKRGMGTYQQFKDMSRFLSAHCTCDGGALSGDAGCSCDSGALSAPPKTLEVERDTTV